MATLVAMTRDNDQPVVLSKIYTKTGDDGTTALGDMSRTAKTDPRLAAYADVDEANAAIGVAMAMGNLPEDIGAVAAARAERAVRRGADLCTPIVDDPEFPAARRGVATWSGWNRQCDEFNTRLKPLRSFILPGGSPGTALLHVARTVTRRAERSTWAALEIHRDMNPLTATYLNRLSDLLFILCRVSAPTATRSCGSRAAPAEMLPEYRIGHVLALGRRLRGPPTPAPGSHPLLPRIFKVAELTGHGPGDPEHRVDRTDGEGQRTRLPPLIAHRSPASRAVPATREATAEPRSPARENRRPSTKQAAMRAAKVIDPAAMWPMPLRPSVPGPAGVPAGKPSPGSITKIPAAIMPAPQTATSRGSPRAARQAAESGRAARGVRAPASTKLRDLHPAQRAGAEQAERVAGQVEALRGWRPGPATPPTRAVRRRRREVSSVRVVEVTEWWRRSSWASSGLGSLAPDVEPAM